MGTKKLSGTQISLFTGDLVVIILATLYGFIDHQTLSSAGSRPLSTILPWALAWFLVGPTWGVFDENRIFKPKQLWRPFWAMILASPVAGFLRALWLGRDSSPLFIIIFGGFVTLGIVAWRGLYMFLAKRRNGRG